MKPVIYTGKVHLGGSGIGHTAAHQVRPLIELGLLERAYVLRATDEFAKDSIQVQLPSGLSYVAEDMLFDGVVALMSTGARLLQSWLAHSLFTAQSHEYDFYVVNCFSAHITEQRRLLEKYTGKQLVHPFSEKKVLRELELATHILAPSEFVFNTLRKHGLADKAKIIPFGADVEKFKPGEKEDDVFRVLFVGRNWVRKGLPYLLAAWSELNLSNAELHIVGVSDEISERYRNVKAEEWADDIVRTYQNADIFCLPAIEDGCPLVTYEALACGLPVIVSETTGTAQHIWNGENGFVVETGRPDQLAEAIAYFYNNKEELEHMSRVARKTALEWTWERFENSYGKWISEILSGSA